MEGIKIYGLCLERLKYQIAKAYLRIEKDRVGNGLPLLLESYNTGNPEEIIDILELYDLENRTCAGLNEKLEDLAYTLSELLREKITFGYTREGHLGLYWMIRRESIVSLPEAVMA